MRVTFHDRWSCISMLHWRVPPDALAPEPLDVRDGDAWLSVVALSVRGPRLGGWVPLGGSGSQLNVRTYLPAQSIRFLRVLTSDRLSALGARGMGMPYEHARVEVQAHEATGPGLRATFLPIEEAPGPLDRWLVDRFRADGPRMHVQVEHVPFALRRARADVRDQNLVSPWVQARPPDLAHIAEPVRATVRVQTQR